MCGAHHKNLQKEYYVTFLEVVDVIDNKYGAVLEVL